jgi:biotin carboxylase
MTERRTLLVLAASSHQVPIIERAKARGFRVVTTDNVPSNPGHRLADRAHSVDTTDAEGVLEIARAERIDGVIASCTDVAVPTAALVASRLGLRGPSPEAAAVLCDKRRFRSWLVEQALPAPMCLSPDAWPETGGAWVLKPERSSGSKGIFIVRSKEELAARLPETLSFSKRALIEAFIPGEQLTCEGLLEGGTVVASWVTRRETASSPYVATWGHRLPNRLDAQANAAVIGAVHDTFTRLGLRDGPFDADVVWDGERAWILEAAPRLGGNSISRLVKIASGVDLVDEVVSYAIGDSFGRISGANLRPAAVVLLGVERAGALSWDRDALRALENEPWVASIAIEREIGERVMPFVNGRHRLGEAFVTADDLDTLDARCREIRARLCMSAAEQPC